MNKRIAKKFYSNKREKYPYRKRLLSFNYLMKNGHEDIPAKALAVILLELKGRLPKIDLTKGSTIQSMIADNPW